MPAAALKSLGSLREHRYTRRARQFLELAHQSASQALDAMYDVRRMRRTDPATYLRGRTSNQDQDLLRAMLVFACAGTDAVTKTLIRDALPPLSHSRPEIQRGLDRFAESYLVEGGIISPRALARVLAHSSSSRQALVEAFIGDLTGGSLQSAEQLDRVCSAFGLDDDQLRKDVRGLSRVFATRNQIIHELDLVPQEEGSPRRQRNIGDMVEMANDVFSVTARIFNAVTSNLEEAVTPLEDVWEELLGHRPE